MIKKLEPWGNYPKFAQSASYSYWREDIAHDLSSTLENHTSTLPYGNGRSYGDSCLAKSDKVLCLRELNRFVSFDVDTGVIIAEAGVTLEEILILSIPEGWFLPVTPGTKYVTLGGAIANDVHGKNHHVRGTFGNHINWFSLVRSDKEKPIICSKNKNQHLFETTISGLGLTGIIELVELQLMPISSSVMNITTIQYESLTDFFQLANEYDSTHEYTVAWIDCLAKGKSIGRGIFSAGQHSNEGALDVNKKTKLIVPFTPPVSIFNKLSLKVFNSAYYNAHKIKQKNGISSYDPFFYPLDGMLYWNRLYGPKGFQQYQCVIPEDNAQSAMHEILISISKSGMGSFLAVMKKCGDISSPGLLSFPMAGVSLALDFPQKSNLNAVLFNRLDKIVCQAGGRLYPAKDAHMSGEHFRQFYPKWEKLEALRDPTLCSRFWNRVTQ